MKYSLTFAAVALIAAVAAQDDNHGIPACAVQCILDATTSSTSCGEKEFSCQCKPENMAKIQGAAIGCVTSSCTDTADQLATLAATKALCANPPPDEGTGSGSSSSEAPTEPSSTEAPTEPSSTEAPTEPTATEEPTATTEAPTEPTDGGAVGEPETVYVTVCSSTQVPGGAAPTGGNPGNGTGTTPTGPATPSFSTGAGAKLSAGLGSVAAFALAALAL
ncbi:hypothetical protein V495_08131 [Pseudogymnoascus sp. VKM F-4514 (FW-929)]|nr:hypothetical protein V490_09142 [Pseudogymnoascus sp. VKM F-3557]KFY34648.1 hypothetical protein V495_08131 [Pseudogymnoascus sp. VKM F-4514 (FW-929)]KFY62771.1 hypothetical protein V497_02237 [Pseudogymnoascus sp. VKM F-4516 (FW-969)]